MSQDVCFRCGERPTCAIAGAAILVVVKDYRGKVTSMCRRCGAAEAKEEKMLVGDQAKGKR